MVVRKTVLTRQLLPNLMFTQDKIIYTGDIHVGITSQTY